MILKGHALTKQNITLPTLSKKNIGPSSTQIQNP